ncbi:siroheme synthase [Niveomyces insectorum RCEF 264]|uniref:Siroheme synthase n=1 Tax=Niveomyces insectorum RCEF 264 TaxID=1081102 RepID=A0A167XMI7_9HYPO|nr:siroheme synthase [Niveomyces insectorum RCEF 264]
MARAQRDRSAHLPAKQQQSSPRTDDASSYADTSTGVLAQCDVFNITFSLHRASPLFVGAEGLTDARLQLIGHRLRDTLVGDVVRGVEVGLDGGGGGGGDGGGAMGNAGALEAVTVEWAAADAVLGTSQPALQVTLQYENALCSALLLPEPDTEAPDSATRTRGPFLYRPLLLLRMPAPLKAVVGEFLSSTFDCRIGSLRLSNNDLVRSWETWALETALPTAGPLAKDAVFTLDFRLPPGTRQALHAVQNEAEDDSTMDSTASLGLKAVDIIVPNDELPRFLKAGRRLGRSGSGNAAGRPFTDALVHYAKQHLALDMANPAVSVTRIACGGFVLSESRMKVFGIASTGLDGGYASRHLLAVRHLLGNLVIRAKGAG